MVESTGVYLAPLDITKEPLDSTRLVTDTALKVWLFSLVDSSTPSHTLVSQNVGLVKLSGIKTRLPIYYAAGFLVLLGLLPKFVPCSIIQAQSLVALCLLCSVLFLSKGCKSGTC
ncbi:MAG: solute carrier family 23 protein [Streptococcus salivarius]